MLEVKIQCDCGQRYKFDVEPVNGAMPYAVKCPICHLDGTAKANEVLRVGGGVKFAPAPAAVAPAPIRIGGAPPAAPTAPPALRISGTPPITPAAPVAVAAPPAIGAPPAPGRIGARPQAEAVAPAAPGKKPNFGLGLLGALVGTTVGSVIYFLILNATGPAYSAVSLLAIGVGYLSGLGADLLGRKEGSKELGVIAAVFMLMGVVGCQYLVARSWWGRDVRQDAGSAYDIAVKEAKKVVAAIPNGTDDEIRAYLAKEDADPGEKPNPQSITAEEIKDFRDTTFKETQMLASGQVAKADYEKKIKDEQAKEDANRFLSDEGTFKAVFLILFLSKANLVSLVVGAGAAFKACANA
jgi:hypothetical protein